MCHRSAIDEAATADGDEAAFDTVADIFGPVVTEKPSHWFLECERGTNNTGEIYAKTLWPGATGRSVSLTRSTIPSLFGGEAAVRAVVMASVVH